VFAIKNIKATYRMGIISWQGDPCLPQELSWEKLRCSYIDLSTPPRIVSLNLSASGLTGRIPPYLQNLTQIQELDLSNNSLTGHVPAFLANMKLLSLINLSGNNLNGSVPQALLDRVKEGLMLKLEGNPDLCKSSLCNPKEKKNFLFPAIASAASLLVIVMVVALIFVFRKKKVPSDVPAPPGMPVADVGHTSHSELSFLSKKIRFTYIEVQQMTNKFERALGEGGFGVVYHGCVNGTQQVAVKVLSQSSSQGYKHFKAEVELLMRVHHINLVSLIGYCDEGDHLALIYEYMPNGDLKQHLSGKRGRFFLSWETRLNIAVNAALGLEYLHSGCKPPMVHRDIKSTNILLDERFQAKLADFGLSRSFPNGNEIYVSTVVAGTPGYLDPEYYQTNWLTEKSDIYSFGIVLLEIITNRPIIEQSREKPHIVEWVECKIRKGEIGNIVDPNIHRDYDIGSAWKAIELAMSCVSLISARRPNMSRVVNDLKECLISEKLRIGESQEMDSMR
ncbi:probable leucine-rich repeat receptor-like protein kinase At2g28990, partial [Eutrema salsugineum]|uniref:probable leucine-rich repeat receptor-like protein kinase At2g28990 n=1 Tax=Eutrema salsugineum TaxID=72664 RepID=UPI000CECFC1D